MDGQEQIVVKTTYKNDLRRFRSEKYVSYNSLYSVISQLYNLQSFIIKYVDDEGDYISVTCDAELIEALRLCSQLSNPTGSVVRLTIFETKNGQEQQEKGEIIKSIREDISFKSEDITPKLETLEEEADKEYPSLALSDWTPSKSTVSFGEVPKENQVIHHATSFADETSSLGECEQSVPRSCEEPVVTETIRVGVTTSPMTISEVCHAEAKKVRGECEAESALILKESLEFSNRTRDECVNYAQKTLADTAKYSREFYYDLKEAKDFYSNNNSAMLCSLSDEIAVQCKALSVDTRRAMNEMRTDYKVDASEWQQMGSFVGNECTQLCEKTSRETVELCKQTSHRGSLMKEESSNTKELMDQCTVLSNETKKNCHDLSSKTTDDCLQISNDIVRIILEL